MTKVLIISEEGRGGGALKRILLVSEKIKNHINIGVVIPSSAPELEQKFKSRGVPAYPIRLHPLTKNILGLTSYILWFIPEIISLVRLMKTQSPDLIHINGSWQFKGLISGVICGIPVIWHLNDTYQPSIIRGVFKNLARRASAVIYASKQTEKYYRSVAKVLQHIKSIIIPAPVKISDKPVHRRHNGAVAKSITVGYINKNKGLPELLVAAERLINDPIEFHIAGPVLKTQRGYKHQLDQMITQKGLTNVKFLGYVNTDSDFLNDYDLYVCSSSNESSPMAVWEAMAAGLPVISTPVGDLPELFKNANAGIVTRTYSGEDLAKAIKKMISASPSERREYGKNAYKLVSTYCSLDNVAKQYIRFYTQLASGPSD